MGKARKQKNTAIRDQEMKGKPVRVTHLNSVEKISQFYQSLPPVEQEAMRQDAARWIGERDDAPLPYPPGTRFVDRRLIESLTEGFFRSLQKLDKAPKEGDHFEATSSDGYKVEALAVATQMPASPTRGVPIAMKVAVFDPEGHYLVAREDTLESSEDQPLHDYYIVIDELGVIAFVHQDANEKYADFILHEGDYLLCYPHWYRGDANGSLQYVGKTSLGAEGEEAPPDVDELRMDLEMLLGMPLGQDLQPTGVMLAMMHFSEYKESAFGPGDYVRLSWHLYRVNEHGIFEHLGKHEGGSTHELIASFERLTGKFVGEIHIATNPAPEGTGKKKCFTFPDDSLDAQVYGFTHGMDMLSIMAFDRIPLDATLPEDFVTNMPTGPDEIEKMGHESANFLLGKIETNSPDQFCEQYAKGFIDGYKFGLYATPRGLMELLRSMRDISDIMRYELSHRFAWELIMRESSEDKDTLMASKLDQLKAMYEEYQAAA